MLSVFRRFANTWAARILFFVLVLAFAAWGIGDMIRGLLLGGSTAVAVVAGHRIEPQEFQEAFQRQLSQMQRMMSGHEVPPELRRQVAQQTLDQLVAQAALAAEVQRLDLTTPDDALRNAVFAMPAFRGPDGKFNRGNFEAVLQNNNLTEARFLELMRADLTQRQLQEAVRTGAFVPQILLKQVFDFQQEKRIAAIIELPFADAPAPAAPTDAELRRYYSNNTDKYSTPEYRRIKAVILSPETIAKTLDIPDSDLQTYYDQHKAEYNTPEKRSAEVLVAQDAASAQKLATQWKGGADWTTMQAAAKAAGATEASLDDAAETEFPSPELAKAVFAAQPDAVSDPVKTPLGWDVVKVTKVTPGSTHNFDQEKSAIRDRLAQERAGDQIYQDANKVDDALAGGTPLDQLPGDLGLAAVTGTLDAQGQTQEGQPAPIPGPPDLRSALIQAAFQMKPGEPAHLTEVPAANGAASSYYAVSVETVTPKSVKPFEQVAEQVKQDWTAAMRRHAQEEVAARVLSAINGGQSIDDAAVIAGAQVRKTTPIGRQGAPEGVPQELVTPLFGLQKGKATMVETPDSFVVAQLTDIQEPDPAKDPTGYDQLKQSLLRAEADDLEVTFVTALRNRDHPRINPGQIEAAIQP